MFITKRKNSSYFQLVYFLDNKRKVVSTKTTDYHEALLFMKNYQSNPQPKVHTIKSITLQKFCDEYAAYAALTKSKYYVRSIKLSFKLLISVTKDIPITSLDYSCVK